MFPRNHNYNRYKAKYGHDAENTVNGLHKTSPVAARQCIALPKNIGLFIILFVFLYPGIAGIYAMEKD